MIQNKEYTPEHEGILKETCIAANADWFWAYSRGQTWNTFKPTNSLSQRIHVPPFFPSTRLLLTATSDVLVVILPSTMHPKSDYFFTFLILSWSITLNHRPCKSWECTNNQGALSRGAMPAITDAQVKADIHICRLSDPCVMGLRTTWGFLKLRPSVTGTNMPPLKIQSLRIFLGFTITHLQVKAYESGDLLCHWEVNLERC